MCFFELRSNDTSISVVESEKTEAQTSVKTQVLRLWFSKSGTIFFFARPILCSIGPSTFKHHEHASQLHMGPGSTVRHDMRAAQETHSCMLLLQLHCKYLFKACPTKQKSNIVGAPVLIRSMMLKATYLQWRHWRALALCGKVKRDFILPVLQR